MLKVIYSAARRFKRRNRFPFLRLLINSMYYDPRTIILRTSNFDFVEVDGCQFCVSDQIDSVQRVYGNPWFANMRSDDVALDIGANIGAITVPLARVVRKVYAVEPLFTEELEQNIVLNRLNNVQIMRCGVGRDRGEQHYEFSSKQGTAPSIPFNTLMTRVGKIDFIKIDGEGCEWSIRPEQLKGIREIRIEFHIRRGYRGRDKQTLDGWLSWLRVEGYRYTLEKGDDTGPCVPFSECLMLNATRSGKWES